MVAKEGCGAAPVVAVGNACPVDIVGSAILDLLSFYYASRVLAASQTLIVVDAL